MERCLTRGKRQKDICLQKFKLQSQRKVSVLHFCSHIWCFLLSVWGNNFDPRIDNRIFFFFWENLSDWRDFRSHLTQFKAEATSLSLNNCQCHSFRAKSLLHEPALCCTERKDPPSLHWCKCLHMTLLYFQRPRPRNVSMYLFLLQICCCNNHVDKRSNYKVT